MRSKVLTLAALLALPGCGLLTQGTSQKVTIKSNPAGAEFQFDGEGPVHRTPHTTDLSRTEHTVKFKAMRGYKETDKVLRTRTSSTFYWSLLMGVIAGSIDWLAGAWQEFETLEDGTTIVFDLEPTDENPEGLVRFSTNPSGASIEINGIVHPGKTGVLGQGAMALTVFWKDSEKEKTVVFKMPKFKDKSLTLRRSDRTVHAELTPDPDRIRVLFESHPPGAEVFVNRQRIEGTTPMVGVIEWEVGDTLPRTVEFRKSGYKSDEKKLNGKTVTQVKGLLVVDQKPAAVRVNCVPAGAEIEVDGTRWGEGPADVTLLWSVEKKSYRIRVSRPGYKSEELTVEESKKDEPLDFRLKLDLPRLP
jgi:hypothetical protein